MSGVLIQNIKDMLEFNKNVIAEIKSARELYEEELKKAREELATTRRQAEETRIEVARNIEELTSEQEKMRVERSQLVQERKRFEAAPRLRVFWAS